MSDEKRRHESDSDSSSDFGPAPAAAAQKKRLKKDIRNKKVLLEALPDKELYERSYMHKDTLTQVEVVQDCQFIITCSVDGTLKFWRKAPQGILAVRTFRPHMGMFSACVAHDGHLMATKTSTDRKIKIFEIQACDVIGVMELTFLSGPVEFIHKKDQANSLLAVAEAVEPIVHIIDPHSQGVVLQTVQTAHNCRILQMKYSHHSNTIISTSANGVIEYWNSEYGFKPPFEILSFKRKVETDLFEIAKSQKRDKKLIIRSLTISPDGSMFAITTSTSLIYLFNFLTGKKIRVYSESIDDARSLQNSNQTEKFTLDELDFGKRAATEQDLQNGIDQQQEFIPARNVVFDRSSNFILYSTLHGIKVVNIKTDCLERIIAKYENTDQFLSIAIFQGNTKGTQHFQQAIGDEVIEQGKKDDPTVFAVAWRRARFFLVTTREPDNDNKAQRDVFNERPSNEEIALLASQPSNPAKEAKVLPTAVVIHTSKGDIFCELYPSLVPKTVENFTTHAKRGFYNNLIFHRVIKDFMIQTGCPLGNGTGGGSIFADGLPDEFDSSLSHSQCGILSMANHGPNTGGSQFFITTVPTKWLDNKHSIFGKVTKGIDVVKAIEDTKVMKSKEMENRPTEDIKMISITVK